jgi:carbonic anhydrase
MFCQLGRWSFFFTLSSKIRVKQRRPSVLSHQPPLPHWQKALISLEALLKESTPPREVPSEEKFPENGEQALNRLLRGNDRFAKGELLEYFAYQGKLVSPAQRLHLIKEQKPFATVFTCSDSRCPAELIFNTGLGELFVVRIAGNVCDDFALASLEYGVKILKTPLLVVLGHQNCGAVKEALSFDPNAPQDTSSASYIPKLVSSLLPPVQTAKSEYHHLPFDELWFHAVKKNVLASCQDIVHRSTIIRELVHSKQLTLQPCVYLMSTGKVELLHVN